MPKGKLRNSEIIPRVINAKRALQDTATYLGRHVADTGQEVSDLNWCCVLLENVERALRKVRERRED